MGDRSKQKEEEEEKNREPIRFVVFNRTHTQRVRERYARTHTD